MFQDTVLVHHVFFWLKNPDSIEDRDALVKGIRGLGKIPGVKGVHVGLPAPVEQRDVIEGGYSVSEILLFDSVEAQATYQAHPLHQKFIAENSPNWTKVKVYDCIKA